MAANPPALAGKRVVVTRAAEQAGELVRALEENGAEVLLLPAVTFVEAEDKQLIDAAILSLYRYDWLLLTSQNVVRFFSARCRELGISPSAMAGALPRIAAVGPATAEAARKEGWEVRHVAELHSGVALAEEIGDHVLEKKVLLPRSDRAGADLPAALLRAGAQVTQVVVYRTLAPESPDLATLEEIRQGRADVLTFASPSAFHSFVEQIGADALRRHRARMAFAAIGPATARAIREAGFGVVIEAAESTAASLVAAIISWCPPRRTPSGASTK